MPISFILKSRAKLQEQRVLKTIIKAQKRKFLGCGIINISMTTAILQIGLVLFPVAIATLISQIFNASLGYLLYGNIVFGISKFKSRSVPKYAIAATFLWALNTLSIMILETYTSSKNIAALLALPFVATTSYLLQKYWVFW